MSSATFAFLVGALAAQAPDRTRAESLARRAGDRLVALQREADRLATDERSLLNELRKLEVDRELRTEQVRLATARGEAIQADIDATTTKMRRLEASEVAARPELRSRLVAIYKLGKPRYARVVLSAPDLRRIGQAARTVAALAKLDRDRIEQHQRTMEELKAARVTFEERKREATAARAAAEKAQVAAARASQAKNDLIREIDRRRDLNAQLAAELQSVQVKLQTALSGGGTNDAITLPVRPFRGDMTWPVNGQLRRRFEGTSPLPGASPTGVEILADPATPVVAVHDGLVAFAGSFAGFGNLVILDHGSQAFSLYGDLLEVSVTKGTRLDRGQPIGSAGPLPAGGTGLYFELRIDGRPVDPLQWLKRK